MAFELPQLKFDYSDLYPYIDEDTIRVHYNGHHQTYTDNLNKAIAGTEYENLPIEEILRRENEIDEEIQTIIHNNGGGYYAHNLYWESLTPNIGTQIPSELQIALEKYFGSIDDFKELFTKTALSQFGSGRAYLVKDQNGDLMIYGLANQDTPIMNGHTPLLLIDIWEHAYYLKYQNKRNLYIENFWNIVDWDIVLDRLKNYEI